MEAQMAAITKLLANRRVLQLISILAYLGSLFFQDHVLRYAGGAGGLEGLLALLTLSTTMVFCYRGYTCLSRGFALNMILVILSVMVVASTLLTLHGQRLTSTLTRVLFKSAKVIPTSIFEGIIYRVIPSNRKIHGCLALVLGSLIYFMSTDGGKGSSETIRTLGVVFLLIGTLLDSAMTCSEEHYFFRKGSFELSSIEAAFGVAFYGIVSLTMFTWILPVLDDPLKNWSIVTWEALKWDLIMFCGASALSYVLHFSFINDVGSLYADSFKAFRKIVAVIVFGVVSKGFLTSPLAVLGVAVCAVGLYFIETGYNLSASDDLSPKVRSRGGTPRVGADGKEYLQMAVSDSVDLGAAYQQYLKDNGEKV